VPHCVDAAIEAVQVASIDETADVVSGVPELEELRVGDHTVLLGSERR
jgi:hypothetical protein